MFRRADLCIVQYLAASLASSTHTLTLVLSNKNVLEVGKWGGQAGDKIVQETLRLKSKSKSKLNIAEQTMMIIATPYHDHGAFQV